RVDVCGGGRRKGCAGRGGRRRVDGCGGGRRKGCAGRGGGRRVDGCGGGPRRARDVRGWSLMPVVPRLRWRRSAGAGGTVPSFRGQARRRARPPGGWTTARTG